MMLINREVTKALTYGKPVNMRKSFDGLVDIIKSELRQNPVNGSLYIFCNKKRNYLKSIFWDGSGYCMFAKKLPAGKFDFALDGARTKIDEQMLISLLDGATEHVT